MLDFMANQIQAQTALGLLCLTGIFCYVGLFAVGGGLVAAAFMQQVLVEKTGLITAEKFYSMLAISESTPGPIGINLATYCGTELYGAGGAIVTTVGEVLPSLVIIMLVARYFTGIQKKRPVQAVFACVRPATGGLVLVALVNVFCVALLNRDAPSVAGMVQWKPLAFYAVAVVCLTVFKKLHPVFVVLAGAVFGVLLL